MNPTQNAQVTLAIEKSAKTFKTEPMDSVLSHEMRQYVIDHDNTIISKDTPERKVAEFEFQDHQVFGIDIMMSSGMMIISDIINQQIIIK